MAGVGKCPYRIVVPLFGHAGLDLALEAVGLVIGLARHRGDRYGAVGAGNLGGSVFQHYVAGLGFEDMARDLQRALPACSAPRSGLRRRQITSERLANVPQP